VLFQTLDDKVNCVGIYQAGSITYDKLPVGLTKTWGYSVSLSGQPIEYASLYAGGQTLEEVCPPELKEEWTRISKKMKSFIRALTMAKISLKDVCVFQMIPEVFLAEWCEIKNKISTYVFENYEKPANYDFLLRLTEVTERIKYQELNIDPSALRNTLASYRSRAFLKKLGRIDPFIYYNVFGTITGRLTTIPGSFPILTMDKKHRSVVKPKNDFFVELDFNAAELRTFISLSGQEQPQQDLHTWNIENVFRGIGTREEAKTRLFAWLYNPNSEDYLLNRTYNREKVLNSYWVDGVINTHFGRKIESDAHHALNRLVQSTSSDLFLRQMIKVDEILKSYKSFISFSVHDSLVIDLEEAEKGMIPRLVEVFGNTVFGEYLVNVAAGRDYGNMRKIL